MISDELYLEAEAEGIIVDCSVSLPNTKSVSVQIENAQYIGIDDRSMESSAEERVRLAHEMGHCMTGSFYPLRAGIDNRDWCEKKAEKWAVKRLMPKRKLLLSIVRAGGEIRPWELAEEFGVTEDFVALSLKRQFGMAI